MCIASLIFAHRTATLADEANFDAEGNCLNVEAAKATATACNVTLRALIEAPCRTSEDVQAKIDYFVSAKNREFYDVMTEVVDMMFTDGVVMVNDLRQLLKSLAIPAD